MIHDALTFALVVVSVFLLRKVCSMSSTMQALSDKIGKLEVSASNLVAETQALKAKIAELSANQEDGPGLQAAIARLDVIQAAIDAVSTPAASEPSA